MAERAEGFGENQLLPDLSEKPDMTSSDTGKNLESPVSESEVEEWFEDEDDQSHIFTSLASKSVEDKYAESQLRVVRTTIDFSLHTLRQNIVGDSYINRSPEYQRRHRWDDKKRSQLIESILMNIPVPPLFLFENDYNKYEVMDGRQRLDTLIDYLDNGFALRGLEFWQELNGKRFRDLSETIQRGLLRRTISAIVLLAETKKTSSDDEQDIRMILFRRLNTGGVMLNPQELRNALYPSNFSKMLQKAARGDDFTRIWSIPAYTNEENTKIPHDLAKNNLYKSMADCELVLRFYAIKETIEGDLKGAMRTLLDKCMQRHQGDTAEQVAFSQREFEGCLQILDKVFAGRPFRLPEGRLSRPLYDALMVSLSLSTHPEDVLGRAAKIRRSLDRALSDNNDYEILVGRGNTIDSIKSRVKLATSILFE